MIKVHLYFMGNVNGTFDLPDGSTARDLIRKADADPDKVKTLKVNDRDASLDQVLKMGDHVHVVPGIAGARG